MQLYNETKIWWKNEGYEFIFYHIIVENQTSSTIEYTAFNQYLCQTRKRLEDLSEDDF